MIDVVGLIPYSESHAILGSLKAVLVPRGDMIEVFQANRSGMNLVSSLNIYRNSAKSRRLRRNCINERDVLYGNPTQTGRCFKETFYFGYKIDNLRDNGLKFLRLIQYNPTNDIMIKIIDKHSNLGTGWMSI